VARMCSMLVVHARWSASLCRGTSGSKRKPRPARCSGTTHHLRRTSGSYRGSIRSPREAVSLSLPRGACRGSTAAWSPLRARALMGPGGSKGDRGRAHPANRDGAPRSAPSPRSAACRLGRPAPPLPTRPDQRAGNRRHTASRRGISCPPFETAVVTCLPASWMVDLVVAWSPGAARAFCWHVSRGERSAEIGDFACPKSDATVDRCGHTARGARTSGTVDAQSYSRRVGE
jgi:hypothetical protein